MDVHFNFLFARILLLVKQITFFLATSTTVHLQFYLNLSLSSAGTRKTIYISLNSY